MAIKEAIDALENEYTEALKATAQAKEVYESCLRDQEAIGEALDHLHGPDDIESDDETPAVNNGHGSFAKAVRSVVGDMRKDETYTRGSVCATACYRLGVKKQTESHLSHTGNILNRLVKDGVLEAHGKTSSRYFVKK